MTDALVDATAADADPVAARFLVDQVYVETDPTGDTILTYLDAEGGRWVHAYSAADLVPGCAVGQEVDSIALSGAALLNRLPSGTGVRLDHGRRHARNLVPAVPHQAAEPTEQAGGNDA